MSLEVFEKLRICLCRLRKSWYSPVKNFTPLTQKKLAGIQQLMCILNKNHETITVKGLNLGVTVDRVV